MNISINSYANYNLLNRNLRKNNSQLKTNTQNNVSFGSLKQEPLSQAKNLLKSFIETMQTQNKLICPQIIPVNNMPENELLLKRLNKDISLKSIEGFEPSGFDKYIKKVFRKSKISAYESANLIQWGLMQEGLKAYNIRLFDKSTKTNPNEGIFFTVLNLPGNAYLHNPQSWGEDAIIIDATEKIALKAQEAIKFYQEKYAIRNLQFTENNIVAPFLYLNTIKTPLDFSKLNNLYN